MAVNGNLRYFLPMKPILLNIPERIETPRLLLRPMQAGDGASMREAIAETMEDLKPWMPWVRNGVGDENHYEEQVRQGYSRWILREDLWLGIFDKKNKRFLGGTGFHRPKWEIPRLEIGYWLRKSAQGQGYTVECVNALTRFAFEALNCKRLEIRCSPRNTRSFRVAEKLGYQLEATLKNDDAFSIEGGETMIFVRFDARGLPALNANW